MATDRVVVAGSSVTAPQLSDLFRQIGDGSLTGAHVQALLDHKNPFSVDMSTETQLECWRVLLLECFGIDLGEINTPERVPGFDRLIVVPEGLTINQIVAEMKNHFTVWAYVDDLDKSVIKNDRTNKESYAVWVRDVVEADEEHKKKSARKLEEEGTKGATLMERLLYELSYFRETGKHLDIKNWTLCSGSRSSDGFVPFVYWNPAGRELRVDWCRVGFACPFLRAREVVS